jgi:glucokinase
VADERTIGVDVGGTKIAAGVVDREGRIERRLDARPTPTEAQQDLLAALDGMVEELVGDDVAAIGFGLPSTIDQEAGRAISSVHIPLADLDFRDRMRERFSLPVGIDNDANAATLAEWRIGAGRGAKYMVMLTLGTGVGGGLVLDGALYRGIAELGHVVVVADGPPCQGNCTGRGHLEAVASGNAADRAAEKLWGEGATAELLVGRAEEGDPEAVEALAGIGHLLGAAVGSFVNTFAPELVIVGGGFGLAAFDFLYDSALEIARRETVVPDALDVRIIRAELAEDAGLIGAGLLAFEAVGAR